MPAKDDPDRDRDAAGETNADPSREKLRDAGKTADDEPEDEESRIRREQATNPALMPIGDPAGAA